MDDELNFDRDMQKFAKFFIKYHPDQNKYSKPNSSDRKNGQIWYNFDYRKKANYLLPTSSKEKKCSPYLKPIMHDTFVKNSNIWILKPVGLNRGRGIEVFNSLELLNDLLNDCFDGGDSKKKNSKKDKDNNGGATAIGAETDGEEDPVTKGKSSNA